MSILINYKICDNAKECGGIEACQTKALFWDKKENKIKIDNSKCTNCGLCVDACPVGAIHVAKTDEEYEELKKEIEEDPRKASDLFVDRYGATPINPDFLITEDEFEQQILQSSELVAVEFFNDDSIECLLNSIQIRNLFHEIEIKKFRKININKTGLKERYKVDVLPTLLFFKEGNFLGKIEGFYNKDQEKEMVDKIKEIIN